VCLPSKERIKQTNFSIMAGDGEGETIARMNGCPVSLKQVNLQMNIERTGQD
jgi:hypothetical protein